MGERAYTVASLAQEWKCSEGVIRKLIVSGQLRCFRVGNLIRVRADEVERFECQNIASSAFETDTPSSGETEAESDTETPLRRPIASGRRQKQDNDGASATVHRGPWAA